MNLNVTFEYEDFDSCDSEEEDDKLSDEENNAGSSASSSGRSEEDDKYRCERYNSSLQKERAE